MRKLHSCSRVTSFQHRQNKHAGERQNTKDRQNESTRFEISPAQGGCRNSTHTKQFRRQIDFRAEKKKNPKRKQDCKYSTSDSCQCYKLHFYWGACFSKFHFEFGGMADSFRGVFKSLLRAQSQSLLLLHVFPQMNFQFLQRNRSFYSGGEHLLSPFCH